MLFVESRVTNRAVGAPSRVAVLERLQEDGLVPLIRSARLHCFEQALTGSEHAKELERLVAARADEEPDEPYVRGDIFCFDDFAHFLIFDDGETPATRAGIVYTDETDDPAGKLEAFCRNVEEAISVAPPPSNDAADGFEGAAAGRIVWRERDAGRGSATARAGAHEPHTSDAPAPARRAERARAVEILEEAEARRFLQRLEEAQAEHRTSEMLAGGAHEQTAGPLAARLESAGLVKREVLVSCRKDGHPLFRLPSPDALSVMTASNAVCSECGAALADERAEELFAPTPLASTLLKDAAWLQSRLISILDGLGVPAERIAARPANAGAEAQTVAAVGGEQFLFVLHDGDFTAAQARRALDTEAERASSHLVVLATGKIQDEARSRLREHARRRARSGSELEVITVEGTEAAAAELRHAFDRVSQKALARELYELDSGAGFNVGFMLAARFRMRHRAGALKDLAASAAGALAGRFKE